MRGEKQETQNNLLPSPLRILIAIDKFKGSLSSAEAAGSLKLGLEEGFVINQLNASDGNILLFDTVEIADGGDGSLNVVEKYCQLQQMPYKKMECIAVNPLGEPIDTSYIIYGNTAFIEMAKISGLELLNINQRNPLYTTTYGLGEVIKHAAKTGAKEITLSIGGSATNDGGTGMLQALGFEFFNKNGGRVTTGYMCGKDLENITTIKYPDNFSLIPDISPLSGIKIKVICDVTNPLLGENGATMVYSAQKGATPQIKGELERGMENYASLHNGTYHQNSGAGAAGGVGYACIAYLGAELISGWRFFAELTNLKKRIAAADIIISGEGKIDNQSLQGKVIDGIIQLALEEKKPVILFCGINETFNEERLSGIKIYSISQIEPNKDKSMQHAKSLLRKLALSAIKQGDFSCEKINY